jgi:hypothetical protein
MNVCARAQSAELEVLKHRLLLEMLEETADFNCHGAIIKEAEITARSARATGYPMLVFPCLFKDRAAAVCEELAWIQRGYWRDFYLTADTPGVVEAAGRFDLVD